MFKFFYQSVTKELAVLEPGTTFRRAFHLIGLRKEAIELKIPDENVCKLQYGCRITIDAGPPRVSMGYRVSDQLSAACIIRHLYA